MPAPDWYPLLSLAQNRRSFSRAVGEEEHAAELDRRLGNRSRALGALDDLRKRGDCLRCARASVSLAELEKNLGSFAFIRRLVEGAGQEGDRALCVAQGQRVASGGAEIKTEGDSFYVVFPSASKAVQCGMAILDAASKSTAPRGGPIQVGIGVHAGETVETAEGYVGSAVNVAARVCSQAKPGELLVTDTVQRADPNLPAGPLRRPARPQAEGDRGTSVVLYRVEPALDEAAALPAKPVTGVRRSVRSAVLLIGLLIGGAAAGYVLLAASRPPPVPSATASQPAAAASFPTAAEADLLGQVPTQVRDRCVRDVDAGSAVSASLRCDLELSADADTVWYQRAYESIQAMANSLSDLTQAQHVQAGTCGPEQARAQGDWSVGSTFSGRMLCYQSDGQTWIVWSYDADRILARATRSGETPADWQGLLSWWDQIRLFLRRLP